MFAFTAETASLSQIALSVAGFARAVKHYKGWGTPPIQLCAVRTDGDDDNLRWVAPAPENTAEFFAALRATFTEENLASEDQDLHGMAVGDEFEGHEMVPNIQMFPRYFPERDEATGMTPAKKAAFWMWNGLMKLTATAGERGVEATLTLTVQLQPNRIGGYDHPRARLDFEGPRRFAWGNYSCGMPQIGGGDVYGVLWADGFRPSDWNGRVLAYEHSYDYKEWALRWHDPDVDDIQVYALPKKFTKEEIHEVEAARPWFEGEAHWVRIIEWNSEHLLACDQHFRDDHPGFLETATPYPR